MLIWETDDACLLVEQGDISDVGIERVACLTPDQLDHCIQFRFRHERLTDRTDGGQLACAFLLGVE